MADVCGGLLLTQWSKTSLPRIWIRVIWSNICILCILLMGFLFTPVVFFCLMNANDIRLCERKRLLSLWEEEGLDRSLNPSSWECQPAQHLLLHGYSLISLRCQGQDLWRRWQIFYTNKKTQKQTHNTRNIKKEPLIPWQESRCTNTGVDTDVDTDVTDFLNG